MLLGSGLVAFFQECQQSRCGQALFHNSRMPPLDQYSAAFVRGAGDSVESTSYTSMVHLGGNKVLVCYDRLGAPHHMKRPHRLAYSPLAVHRQRMGPS